MKQPHHHDHRGFTLIELLVTMAIVGVLSSSVILAIGPKKQLTSARDAERYSASKELSNAMYQRLIDEWELPNEVEIPECTSDDLACAKPICKENISDEECNGNGGVSLAVLPPEYLAALPVDPVMPENARCTGYMVYKQTGRPKVFSANIGKLPGDELEEESLCGLNIPSDEGDGGEDDDNDGGEDDDNDGGEDDDNDGGESDEEEIVCGDGVKSEAEECDPFEVVSSCMAGETCNASSCVCEAANPACTAPNVYTGPETGTMNVSATEDTALVVAAPGVLAYVPGALSAEQTNPTVRGFLSLNEATGAFYYRPFDNFNGLDGFQFRTFDGTNYSDPQWAVITVNPVNDVIIANDDAYVTDQNSTLNIIAANGVLDNDSGLEAGETLTVSLVGNPSHGSINLQTDGSFSYQPETGFTGTDSFTYKVNDGTGDSNNASASIIVKEPGAAFDGVESVTINDGNSQRSMVTSMTIRFKTLVTFEDGAFALTNRKTAEAVTLQAAATNMPNKTSVVLSFAGPSTEYASLADGNYLLTVDGSKVHAGASTLNTYQFGTVQDDRLCRLFGDGHNGDRDVDGSDLAWFRTQKDWPDSCDATYIWYFDSDQNNVTNQADLTRFSANYGRRLAWE